MVFGRTERSDIVISEDPLLSSCHFRIAIEGDQCQIEDLQSTNGTKLNDQRIMIRPLGDGDRIVAGQSTFTIQADSAEACLQSTWVPSTGHDTAADTDVRIQSDNPSPPADHAASPENDQAPRDQARQDQLPESQPQEEFDAYGTSETSDNDAPQPSSSETVEPVSAEPVAGPPATKKEDDLPSTANSHNGPSLAETLPPQQLVRPKQEPPQQTLPPADQRATPPPSSPSPILPLEIPGVAPENFQLKLARCATGLWIATQTAPAMDAADLSVILAGHCPLRLIVDFHRTGLPGGETDDATVIMPGSDNNHSPHMLNADNIPMDQWVRSGWSQDGIIVLVTHVDIEPLVEYFGGVLSSENATHHGISTVCWPSMLESVLSKGDPGIAQQIMEPCEAILLESLMRSEDGRSTVTTGSSLCLQHAGSNIQNNGLR